MLIHVANTKGGRGRMKAAKSVENLLSSNKRDQSRDHNPDMKSTENPGNLNFLTIHNIVLL